MAILKKEKLETALTEAEVLTKEFENVMNSNSSSMKETFVHDNMAQLKKIIEMSDTIIKGTTENVFSGSTVDDGLEIGTIKNRASDCRNKIVELFKAFEQKFTQEMTQEEFEAPVVSEETIKAAQAMSDSMQVIAKDMVQAKKESEEIAAKNIAAAAVPDKFGYKYALSISGKGLILIPDTTEDESIKMIQMYLSQAPGCPYALYELTASKKSIKLSIV